MGGGVSGVRRPPSKRSSAGACPSWTIERAREIPSGIKGGAMEGVAHCAKSHPPCPAPVTGTDWSGHDAICDAWRGPKTLHSIGAV